MKINKIVIIIGVSLLIVGNVWCYLANDRILHPMTSVSIIGLMVVNSLKKDDK